MQFRSESALRILKRLQISTSPTTFFLNFRHVTFAQINTQKQLKSP